MFKSTRSYVLSTVAALTLTTAGTLAAPAAVAAENTPGGSSGAAAACPWNQGAPPANLNPYRTKDYAAVSAPVRVGPYGACGQVGTLPVNSSVTVDCYVTNSYGNTWSYIHGYGWVWDSNLVNGGSPDRCRF